MKRKYIIYILVLAVFVAAVSFVGSVYAIFVADISGKGEIDVIPASLKAVVTETSSGTALDFQIKNDENSSMPCFIRFALVINWSDGEGNLLATPVKATDYTLTYNDAVIKQIGNYYYCCSYVGKGEYFTFTVTQKSRTDDDNYILDACTGKSVKPECS